MVVWLWQGFGLKGGLDGGSMQKLINIVLTSSFSGIPQIRSSGIVCHNSLCCKSDKCTIVVAGYSTDCQDFRHGAIVTLTHHAPG